MNSELTAFDIKFLSDCGIAIDGGPAPDEEANRAQEDEAHAAAIYYRRIFQDLG